MEAAETPYRFLQEESGLASASSTEAFLEEVSILLQAKTKSDYSKNTDKGGDWSESGLDARYELSKGAPPLSSLREGDIVFQSDKSQQGRAVQLATKSPLTHCGVLFKENGEWIVYEAVQPVRKTPLSEFARNGDNGSFVARRLNTADQVLNEEALAGMKDYLESNLGKNYDHKFQWSDEKIYCSELVWKAYFHATGMELGNLSTINDYDLSSPEVQRLIKERYGNHFPLDEKLIGPGDIYASELLSTVR